MTRLYLEIETIYERVYRISYLMAVVGISCHVFIAYDLY